MDKEQKFLNRLWSECDETTHRTPEVSSFEVGDEFGFGPSKVRRIIETNYPIIEYGVSPRWPWFTGNPTYD